MLRPVKPSSAGSSVTEAAMTTSTASDTVKANPVRDGWPTSRMPSIETMTVRPANTHGPPGGRDRGQRWPVAAPGPRRGCCGTG